MDTTSNRNWERVWQSACGDSARDYRPLFSGFGLLATGAVDDEGPYSEGGPSYVDGGEASRKIWPVAAGMLTGDTVVLKMGKSIVAVGQVAGDYACDGRQDGVRDLVDTGADDQGRLFRTAPGSMTSTAGTCGTPVRSGGGRPTTSSPVLRSVARPPAQ